LENGRGRLQRMLKPLSEEEEEQITQNSLWILRNSSNEEVIALSRRGYKISISIGDAKRARFFRDILKQMGVLIGEQPGDQDKINAVFSRMPETNIESFFEVA
jgi:hypothetical protein